MRIKKAALSIFFLGMTAFLLSAREFVQKPFQYQKTREQPMKITSTAFDKHQMIPPQYTCDGKNINPPEQEYGFSSLFRWLFYPDDRRLAGLNLMRIA